ncbi:hypothetical protein ABT297_23350 [Dactylosporangium sp. NPDC000555]|uniref:hypothetical protein n=1 Tax=Dactylosporangium sp. NPDC000555 TaxID=3154260 RepID=UPI003322F0E3
MDELTAAVLEHSAVGFVLFPRDDATIDRWAREVARAVREAVIKWRSTSDIR